MLADMGRRLQGLFSWSPHPPPPLTSPRGINIDRQYAALVNMTEAIRTTRAQHANCFWTPVWPAANRAQNHVNSELWALRLAPVRRHQGMAQLVPSSRGSDGEY